MGNQCCDKQSKHAEIDRNFTRVLDDNDKEIPPAPIPLSPRNGFHRATNDSVSSNQLSNGSTNNNHPGRFASIIPPSIKG